MAKVAIVISLFVLFQITLASPTLPTCDEDGDTDCADGDMQCKWRKATCMMQKAAMEGTKAAYGEDFMEDRNEWVAESREALSILAHTLLGKRTRTHVVHLMTEYQQGGTPLFKIMEWGVLSLAELAALQDGHEKLVEQLEEHMKRAPVHVKEKTGTDAAVAYVVVACRSMEAAAVVVPLGVPKVAISTVSPEDVVKVLNSGKIRPSK